MGFSIAELAELDRVVNAASVQELDGLHRNAQETLYEIDRLMSQKLLDKVENEAAAIAIELLVRSECRMKGGDRWYRLKRRAQLAQTFLGSGGKEPSQDHAGQVRHR